MLSLETARNLKPGDTLYCTYAHAYRKGEPARVRVTSVKTWKTRPDVVVSYKHGLREYGTIAQYDLGSWTTDYAEAIAARPPLPMDKTATIRHHLETAAENPSNTLPMLQAAKAAAIEAAYRDKSIAAAMVRALKAAKLEQQQA